MKKLLSLLGIIGLTTTASISVVACGSVSKEEDSTGEDVSSYIDSQIKYLQNKIQKTVSEYYSQNLVKFVEGFDEQQSTSYNSFLTYEKLEEIISSNQGEDEISYNLVESDSSSESNDLISDIKTKIDYNSIKEEINAYDENISLISQNIDNIIDDNSLSIENETIKISPVYSDDEIVQIKVDFNLQINYKYNQSNEIQESSIIQPISWSIFKEEGIANVMASVASSLALEMYGDNLLNFTETDFGIANTPFIPADSSDFVKNETVNESLLNKFKKGDTIGSSITEIINNSGDISPVDKSMIGVSDITIDALSIEKSLQIKELELNTSEKDLLLKDTSNFQSKFNSSRFYKDLNTNISSLSESFLSFSEGYGLNDATDLSKHVSSWGTFILQGIIFNYTVNGSTTTYQFNDIVLPYNYQITNQAAYNVFSAYGVDETNTLAERFKSAAGTSENLLLDNYQYVVAYQILVFIDKFGVVNQNQMFSAKKYNGDDESSQSKDVFELLADSAASNGNDLVTPGQWKTAWKNSYQFEHMNDGMGSIGGYAYEISSAYSDTNKSLTYEESSSGAHLRKYLKYSQTTLIKFGNVYFSIYDSVYNEKTDLLTMAN